MLLALAVPLDHETLDPTIHAYSEETEEPGPGEWQRANLHAILFYVGYLPPHVQALLNQLSPGFRPAYSTATLTSYWANHCKHCGLLLDDHELHCEPDGAFMPSSESAAAEVRLLQINASFEAMAAGYSVEPEFFAFMSKGCAAWPSTI
ncbi:MAG: hypothetical protein NVS1B6_20920 [Steroidobacteraceae bacterium]